MLSGERRKEIDNAFKCTVMIKTKLGAGSDFEE